MNCDEALLAISAALDGELPPRERAKLSEHLLACPACRELAEDLRVLTGLLEDSEAEPPAGLAASIKKAVAQEASHAVKRRRPPYLRTVAALLALCICLGGVGLFVSRLSKGDSAGGAAPAMFYEAAPRSMENEGADMNGAAYDAFGAGPAADDGYDPSGGGPTADGAPPADPEAPMPSSAPEPAPEPAPEAQIAAGSQTPGASCGIYEDETTDPDANGIYEKEITGSDAFGTAPEEKSDSEGLDAFTPEEALELVFRHVGGYETFPDARQRQVSISGSDAPAYCLKTVEAGTVSSEYCLDYVGVDPDGVSFRFHLFELVTDEGEDGSGHTATVNWYTVSPDGELTALFPETPID